jgi:hypothetical protein
MDDDRFGGCPALRLQQLSPLRPNQLERFSDRELQLLTADIVVDPRCSSEGAEAGTTWAAPDGSALLARHWDSKVQGRLPLPRPWLGHSTRIVQ